MRRQPQPRIRLVRRKPSWSAANASFENMAQALSKGHWDGDRDSLADAPDARDWSLVAAERHTCTVRHCPHFRGCSYYEARLRLADANVIVANHDLVLASLGMETLPDLDKCLVVFDEGHHLPAVALDQFGSHMDLSNLRWLDRLPRPCRTQASSCCRYPRMCKPPAATLKASLTALARMALDTVWRTPGAMHAARPGWPIPFSQGLLPETWEAPVSEIGALAAH